MAGFELIRFPSPVPFPRIVPRQSQGATVTPTFPKVPNKTLSGKAAIAFDNSMALCSWETPKPLPVSPVQHRISAAPCRPRSFPALRRGCERGSERETLIEELLRYGGFRGIWTI